MWSCQHIQLVGDYSSVVVDDNFHESKDPPGKQTIPKILNHMPNKLGNILKNISEYRNQPLIIDPIAFLMNNASPILFVSPDRKCIKSSAGCDCSYE